MQEIYKNIKGYEGLYQVSNLGNVKALDRFNIDKNGKKKFYPSKILKPDITKSNTTSYARVTLSKNGKITRKFVHTLVAEAYLDNPENKAYVNHIDNNGLNNVVNNLEWCTHSENMVHAQKQGRLHSAQSKGGKTIGSKLRNMAVEVIKTSIGCEINNYLILEYTGFKKDRHYVAAKCLRCNSITELAYRHITRGKNTRCRCCRNVKDVNIDTWRSRNKI